MMLVSCGKPEYWIRGLDLPPGSTEVSKTESEMADSGTPPMPMGIKFKKMLLVSFKNPGGWDAVCRHFDACLTRQGYSESMQNMLQGIGSMGGYNPAEMMRMYSKTGSQYCVMVQNMGGMMGAAGAPPGMSGMMDAVGIGEFSVSVMLMEK